MTSHAPPRAVIVTVGDELLLGETVDSNAAWLGRRLEGLGLQVVKRYTVGDVEDDIREAVRRGLEDAAVVVVTGGLGPTSDDVTRESVAALLERPLAVDDELLSSLRERFRRRGYDPMPERNVSQAQVPRGASVLANPIGTAPGLAMAAGDGMVVLLPGVPSEMKAIVEHHLRSALAELLAADLPPVHHRLIHTWGIPESELGKRVDDALPADREGVGVAFLPDDRGVTLRLTVRGVGEGEARRRLDRIESLLAPVVERYRFRSVSGDLVESVSEALEAAGIRLAAAESCTGGLLAKRMTDRPGSSRVFLGGVVAYANEVKIAALGVAEDTLLRVGAVSEEVALEMAAGVRRALGSEVGVAITGVAGPDGGTEEKPVGLVWLAVDIDGRSSANRVDLPGDRAAVRERAVQAALMLLLRRLEDRE